MSTAEALEILRATQLHRDADRGAAASAFARLEARLAQLEKVAELARPVAAQDAGPFRWADACRLLDLALTELDHHPDTREI